MPVGRLGVTNLCRRDPSASLQSGDGWRGVYSGTRRKAFSGVARRKGACGHVRACVHTCGCVCAHVPTGALRPTAGQAHLAGAPSLSPSPRFQHCTC